jgi:hypothetical protein
MVVGFYAVYAAREQDPRPHETGETSQAVDTVRAAGERGRSARVEARRDPAVSDVRPDRSARFSVDSLPDAFGALGERVPSELPEREPSDSDDSERGSAIPIVLNTLFVESGDPGIELSGVDVLGPRDLVAWRIKNGRHAIVARGWSDRSGEIHFPELVAPRDGLEIVVTAANTTPEVPGASAARRSSPLPPSAPDAVVLDAYGSEYAVRIVPSEATGNILLADADGRVFAQYAVPGTAIASGRVVDVTLGLPPGDTHVLVAHVLKDGRRSDWREIELGRPDGD